MAWRGLFERPPRLVFHGVLVATTLMLLWTYSFPGFHVVVWAACLWILGVAALTWLARGATYLLASRRGAQQGSPRWFAVAPVGAVLALVLLVGGVPLKARWHMSKSSFQREVEVLREHPELVDGWRPRRVGTYDITHTRAVDEGILFYERVGALLDDAGFAYLPNGPTPEMASGMFENPQWYALGGPWYSWTAGW